MNTTKIQPEPRRRHRWFQFSLRTLLVVMALASIGMSWVAVKLRQAQLQDEAAEEIRKLGGIVWYDCNVPNSGNPMPKTAPPAPAWLRNLLGDNVFGPAFGVSFPQSIVDADLEHLKRLTQLQELDLPGMPLSPFPGAGASNQQHVTDAGLENLKGLTQLRALTIRGPSRITDAGLVHLRKMTQLRFLFLAWSQVGDAGLEHLKEKTQLQTLILNHTPVTDDGLKHLGGLSQLQQLDLSETQITDAGLDHLRGLTTLWELRLLNTRTTDAGVKRLQRVLPKCKIER